MHHLITRMFDKWNFSPFLGMWQSCRVFHRHSSAIQTRQVLTDLTTPSLHRASWNFATCNSALHSPTESLYRYLQQLSTTIYTHRWLGGIVVRVLDSRPRGPGFNSRPVHRQAATLGKLLTPLSLCYQAVQFGTGQRAVMLCGREGNRGSGVALAMRHMGQSSVNAELGFGSASALSILLFGQTLPFMIFAVF